MEKLVPAGLNNGIHAYLYVCNVKQVVLISRMYLVWFSFSQNICQMGVRLRFCNFGHRWIEEAE